MTSENFTARLDAIERECSKPDWDSYGAPPVSKEAIAAARRVCPVPCNDGGISIDYWMYKGSVERVYATIEFDRLGRFSVVDVCSDSGGWHSVCHWSREDSPSLKKESRFLDFLDRMALNLCGLVAFGAGLLAGWAIWG